MFNLIMKANIDLTYSTADAKAKKKIEEYIDRAQYAIKHHFTEYDAILVDKKWVTPNPDMYFNTEGESASTGHTVLVEVTQKLHKKIVYMARYMAALRHMRIPHLKAQQPRFIFRL